MKEYVKLSIDAEGYHSGSTYYEEVFLPKEVWEEIQDDVRMYTYIHGLDGKHSEVQADIERVYYNEKELQSYIPNQENDSEKLFYHLYEYLDENIYKDEYLEKIQEEVQSLRQIQSMTIQFKSSDKEKIEALLRDYIL